MGGRFLCGGNAGQHKRKAGSNRFRINHNLFHNAPALPALGMREARVMPCGTLAIFEATDEPGIPNWHGQGSARLNPKRRCAALWRQSA
jgi:hypothetical protein